MSLEAATKFPRQIKHSSNSSERFDSLSFRLNNRTDRETIYIATNSQLFWSSLYLRDILMLL